MKFYGTPFMLVKERKKKKFSTEIIWKPLFRFDGNGEFETNDEKLIQRLKNRFEHAPVNEEENNATGEEIKTYQCKKCEFTCTNKGELMRHYKTHKEE